VRGLFYKKTYWIKNKSQPNYNESFKKCAAAVNLPGALSSTPPNNMNGLVDRSTAFINALMVLEDVPKFETQQHTFSDQPENFTRRTVPW
jgi:hypothetical protein